jgi:hypothetical protein
MLNHYYLEKEAQARLADQDRRLQAAELVRAAQRGRVVGWRRWVVGAGDLLIGVGRRLKNRVAHEPDERRSAWQPSADGGRA